MSIRRLVITADDLGRDPATDATVLDLLAAGHITATTLLTVGAGAAAAAAGALALGVQPRLHLTLTSEAGIDAWPARSGRARLMDDDGALRSVDQLTESGASVDDVLAEIAAQLAWLRERGVTVRGTDSHAGTLYGLDGAPWLAPVLQWCAEERLAFRLPRDLRPYVGTPPPGLAARHRHAVALADRLGVRLPAAMITNRAEAPTETYEVLRARMIAALDTLPPGTSELFLHPAEGLPGTVGTVRAWEARLLRDPVWHQALRRAAVEPVACWWSEDL